jgi:hypothetical protein
LNQNGFAFEYEKPIQGKSLIGWIKPRD